MSGEAHVVRSQLSSLTVFQGAGQNLVNECTYLVKINDLRASLITEHFWKNQELKALIFHCDFPTLLGF
jgi:hypothetical protein